MKNYTHLSLGEREILFALKEQGVSLREIGRRLNRDHTSLSRELSRNKTGKGKNPREYFHSEYLPVKAEEKAFKRARQQRKKAPLKGPFVWLYVREHLREPFSWSPEQISGRLEHECPEKSISPETIYRYIYSSSAKRYHLWKYLTNCRKKRMKKVGRRVKRASKIPNAILIDQRSETINQRSRLGDWETDNLSGQQKDRVALSVSVERLTRTSLLSLTDKSALGKTRRLVKRLKSLPPKARLSLTADNGSENTLHQKITQSLGIPVFFCHPYSSWERGTVENLNQRIRRYLPKGVSLDNLTVNRVRALEEKLNSTPRKCLGYLTPYEKMIEVLSV